VHKAADRACIEHHDWVTVLGNFPRREEYAQTIRELRHQFLYVQQEWNAVPVDIRTQVGIISRINKGTFVRDYLVEILDALLDYDDWYGGDAEAGRPQELAACKQFILVLSGFWGENTDKPFGHVTERDYEREGSDGNSGDLVPKSDFLKFVWAASRHCALPYKLESLEAAVRFLKSKGRIPSRKCG
jgi:hypothetical protein